MRFILRDREKPLFFSIDAVKSLENSTPMCNKKNEPFQIRN